MPVDFYQPWWYRPGFLAFLNKQKLTRGQTRNSGKALLGPLLQQWGARTSYRFPCSLAPLVGGKWAGSLYGVSIGGVQGSGQRGGLSVLSTPLVVLSAGSVLSTLLLLWTPCFFAPRSSEMTVGRFFVLFVSFVHNLSQLHMHAVIFSPL